MLGDIQIDLSEVNKVVKGLKGFEKQMPGAAMSAINRTLDHVATKIGRLVTAEYIIKTSDVKATFVETKRAIKSNLAAHIKSKSRRLTFSHFPISRSKNGVRVKVKRSGYKSINTYPGAFTQVLAGQTQVMRRRGDSRYPVDVLRTLSVPQMIDSTNVSEKIQEVAKNKLAERIEHEINYRLSKIAKK